MAAIHVRFNTVDIAQLAAIDSVHRIHYGLVIAVHIAQMEDEPLFSHYGYERLERIGVQSAGFVHLNVLTVVLRTEERILRQADLLRFHDRGIDCWVVQDIVKSEFPCVRKCLCSFGIEILFFFWGQMVAGAWPKPLPTPVASIQTCTSPDSIFTRSAKPSSVGSNA